MKHLSTAPQLHRRQFLQRALAFPAAAIFLNKTAIAASSSVTVLAYRNPGCGCCEKWSGLMKAAGFEISMEDDPDLSARKAKLGVPTQIAGCHTALIGPYVFEGHVPPEDIIIFLAEKPEALGLAVAGMPVGSPGMEMGESKDPYDVLMFKADGTWTSYAKHS
jgi:hypothetical protein